MSSPLPTLGFLGDTAGALATQVGGHVNLTAFSGSLGAGQQGLLIDGSTAPKLDQKSLANVLNAGGLLAVADPTAEHANLLRAITGQAPFGKVGMIGYKKTSNRAGYKCLLVPYGQMSSSVAGEGQPPQKTVGAATVSLGKSLADAALDTTDVGIAPPGLVPPQGALAGYSSFQSPCPWNPGYPNINGNYDDNTAKQNTQPINNQFLTEFFIYWVNGGMGANFKPYYVAILRQTGSMSIGTVLANSQNSRGWFNLYFQLLPNIVTINGNAMPSGVQLASHAPTGGSGSQVPIAMQIPMTLNADLGNGQGSGSVQFVATVNSSIDYSNWAVLDQIAAGNTAWQVYQTTGWNPVQYPPGDANTWWSAVYNNGNVVAMADQSFGSIPFEMVTCWTFDSTLFTAPSSSPFTPPPALQVGFSGGWHQSPGFLHNHPGCHGAAGGEHFHIWGNDYTWTWNWTFDFDSTVNNQNID